jgi:hypothetical protein
VDRATDYLEGVLDGNTARQVEVHLAECDGCRIYLEQMRHTIRAMGALRHQPVSSETKERLRQLFRAAVAVEAAPTKKAVPLGIGSQTASLGDHIAYFWENELDFTLGVAFLEVGLRGNDFCVIFGHEQGNEKVLEILSQKGFDVQRLIQNRRLCVLGGGPAGESMLVSIGAVFTAAVEAGAPIIRLLGNIGWGRQGWPEEDDILAFEARVTEAAKQFPCVVVCMYDVASLSGRILLKGGFGTHPLTVCHRVLRANPHYVPVETFLAELNASGGSQRIQ